MDQNNECNKLFFRRIEKWVGAGGKDRREEWIQGRVKMDKEKKIRQKRWKIKRKMDGGWMEERKKDEWTERR